MALFGNESDKIKHSEDQAKPQPSVTPPTSAMTATSEASACATTYLDRAAKVTGQLNFEGPAKIDGHVEGEIKGVQVTIGDGAVVKAQITAESVVCGRVDGDLVASKRIEIRPTGKIAGNVTAPVLVIQEGGQFEGHCAMAKESEARKTAANHYGARATA